MRRRGGARAIDQRRKQATCLCAPTRQLPIHPAEDVTRAELLASPSELLASPRELLASPRELLASPSTSLRVTQRALSVTQHISERHPASSQRHPASSQCHPASSERHPAGLNSPGLVASAAGVSYSPTSPFSMSRMRSASMMVCRRCAIVRHVQPASSERMHR
jgi:hypothetical protein